MASRIRQTTPPRRLTRPHLAAIALATIAAPTTAQTPPTLDRVLAFPTPIPGEELQADRGAAGAWHRIRKLATTASILHVTAHPDDEHSGMLALASRGWGARTALLSLNRGEAGANAIGPELFDALGLIRTRELVLAGRYYGLDDLYFTTAVDYGYSKSVEEAFRSWDRETVLEDMVRVIRLNRPLVVVARFHGTARDGHGHHHAAGLLTPEAVAAAADPERFPDQISREGLRPWRVLRVYRGGVREGEPHDVTVDANEYNASLGTTYQRFASLGLSLQRSQTSGRMRRGGGQVYRYELLAEASDRAGSGEKPDFVRQNRAEVADNFPFGLDTRLTRLSGLLGEQVGPGIERGLAEVQAAIDEAVRDFDFTAPEASVAGLARGLVLLRSLMERADVPPELGFHLAVKERQFQDAMLAAAGVEVRAELASDAGGAVVVPGEEVEVAIEVENVVPVEVRDIAVIAGRNRVRIALDTGHPEAWDPTYRNLIPFDMVFDLRIPTDADAAGPYFARVGLAENHYQIADSADLHLPWRRPELRAEVAMRVDSTLVATTVPVTGSVSRLPYGSLTRRVDVLPTLSVAVTPVVRVVAAGDAGAVEPAERGDPDAERGGPGVSTARDVEVLVRVDANAPDVSAEAELELPAGWTATPASIRHDFRGRGEVVKIPVTIHPPADWSGDAVAEVVARVVDGAGDGVDPSAQPSADEAGEAQTDAPPEYREGYQVIDHRDLPLARLRIPARTTIRSVAVTPLDDLVVGYVMGVGDEVPAAIEALGASVRLLNEADLPGGELDAYDAIVVGTRAYAVRRDLLENNQRLLDYARGGGNLVVLYQTQEFVPSEMAPYPASLPPGAQEVSEQDAPVQLLAPSHPLLTTPNRISEADFDGWLEQRGSKFFAEWDQTYTPLVETHDTGQAPQRGVWLTAAVGEGHYSYVALALHRQLPYGVPGAYRILSNLLWSRPPTP